MNRKAPPATAAAKTTRPTTTPAAIAALLVDEWLVGEFVGPVVTTTVWPLPSTVTTDGEAEVVEEDDGDADDDVDELLTVPTPVR